MIPTFRTKKQNNKTFLIWIRRNGIKGKNETEISNGIQPTKEWREKRTTAIAKTTTATTTTTAAAQQRKRERPVKQRKPQTLLHCFLSFYPIFISGRLSRNPLSMVFALSVHAASANISSSISSLWLTNETTIKWKYGKKRNLLFKFGVSASPFRGGIRYVRQAAAARSTREIDGDYSKRIWEIKLGKWSWVMCRGHSQPANCVAAVRSRQRGGKTSEWYSFYAHH